MYGGLNGLSNEDFLQLTGQASAFPVLAREIFDAVRSQHSDILNEGGVAG